MNNKKNSLPLLNKPSPYGKQLLEALLPYGEARRYSKGVRLELVKGDVKLCHLLISGSLEVHRNSDHLLIVTIPGPVVIGLGVHDAYLIMAEPCHVATMTLEDAQRYISEKNLWELVTHQMMLITNKLYTYSKQLSAPTVYELICNQLIELINEPETIRKKISVERYIREKAHVSRSSVMKILSDLRMGGYIVIEDGRLIEIRHLPSKY
ncbi:helix-turn-helix domain-containing protein [Citrobacter farmeri]|uniref:IprA winged helix-turn-helix domain-containing protein n=1 Tax=Citrobacter amalonaticus Y19 TaxID=1261127 RepID=M1JGM9_CITAM|nr:winged helix-turn-helix transcriptional regulator [Citrobacter amalonaticus]AGE94442.1 hypothetical protein F384_07945 [Citrobacter amalonaticus Y19]EKV5654384.1 helix-turn-helix domain-containing protein [Citrobacter farmeri]